MMQSIRISFKPLNNGDERLLLLTKKDIANGISETKYIYVLMGIDLRNMMKGNIANPKEMYKSLNIFFDQLPQMKLLSINQISIVYNVGISVFIFTKKPTLFFCC